MIAVSLFVLAIAAYLHCTQMSQIKFVSSDLGFENPDQEEGLADGEKELKAHGSSALLIVFLLGPNLFEHSPHLFQAPSLQQRIMILRC